MRSAVLAWRRRIARAGAPAVPVVVLLAGLLAPAAARAAAPSVTIATPASGAVYTSEQPTISGTGGPAGSYSGTVTVDIYAGSSPSAFPSQVIPAGVSSSGAWHVTPNQTLAAGTYTVQASETDNATPPDLGMSSAVTFEVAGSAPGIELDPPSSEPIVTATPTFQGTGSTEIGASGSVQLLVFDGGTTETTPIASDGTSVASNGSYSIQVEPSLANGRYTAIAEQTELGSEVFSAPVTFAVVAGTPGLTLTAPTSGESISQADVTFSGAAGNGYGDSASVDLALYRGSSATGTPTGTLTVTESGGSWKATWPTELKLGIYTVEVEQHNTSGDVTKVTRRFIVVPPAKVIDDIAISQTGIVTAPVSCLATGGSCTGDILIDTKRSLRTEPGGPTGPLRVLFAHFSISAGSQVVVTGQLSPLVLAVLRRLSAQRLEAVVVYRVGSSTAQFASASQVVTVGSR